MSSNKQDIRFTPQKTSKLFQNNPDMWWTKRIWRNCHGSSSYWKVHVELSHGGMRFPQTDNSVEDENSHHASCLIRRHGSPSSQSSRCLLFLQSWWKHLEFQHFHLLAAGFNIQAPSLNNKHETVSSSDANVIKNDAALTAILLHHADIFPKAEGVIHPVPLRNSSSVWWWWWWWGGGVTESLCLITDPFITMSPMCPCVTTLHVLFQVCRCEKSLNFQGC